MGHFSAMFTGLARSLSLKKQRNSGNCDGREAAVAMAREAKKSDLILKSSGHVIGNRSNTFASVYTKRGQKGINQDCCIVWEEFGFQRDMILCGIFDGHGAWGHYVAKMVRDSMPISLLCNWQETVSVDLDFDLSSDNKLRWFNIWKHSFIKTCAAIDKELKQHRKVDSYYSGTTAVSVVRQGKNVIIANVGDSRAVLATTSDDGSLAAVQLTIDFKPNLPQEAERIIQSKGRVYCLSDEPGVHRLWLPDENSPGLAMSRALGDHCVKDFGLISVPELTHKNIAREDEFIVLASDGVWDVVSNQEAVQIVFSAPDRASSARCLVKHAARAWKRRGRGIAMDDISAICIFLHHPSSTSELVHETLAR